MAIAIRSPREIECLAAVGAVLDQALAAALDHARPGVTTLDIAAAVERQVRGLGAVPVLLGHVGPSDNRPFPGAICACVNEQVVHAPPGPRHLRAGDILTIDLAIARDGWHADAARSTLMGDRGERAARLASVARQAADLAASLLTPGRRWSQVIARVRERAAADGMSILTGFDGHGIGRQLHEPPRCGFHPSTPDFVLRPGMVLCVEPIVCESPSPPATVSADDGWTVLTADRSWTAHEERCVAVTLGPPRVLAGAA